MSRLIRETKGKEEKWDIDIIPHSKVFHCINLSLSINSPNSNEGEFILQLAKNEVEALIVDLQEMLAP